jgi:hypothetical protein
MIPERGFAIAWMCNLESASNRIVGRLTQALLD